MVTTGNYNVLSDLVMRYKFDKTTKTNSPGDND